MKLIAGLGNPGKRYERTRHNVGFMVADEVAQRWKTAIDRFDRHYEGLLGEAHVGGERVILLKPMTFMNLSGASVNAVIRFYKLTPPDALIVYDDLDLPLGRLRVRADGSAGGHRGMSDIVARLGSSDVPRIRIGIGKVHKDATVDHVLGTFAPDEREPMEQAIASAADAVECWVREGVTAAMNRFNRRDAEPRP